MFNTFFSPNFNERGNFRTVSVFAHLDDLVTMSLNMKDEHLRDLYRLNVVTEIKYTFCLIISI